MLRVRVPLAAPNSTPHAERRTRWGLLRADSITAYYSWFATKESGFDSLSVHQCPGSIFSRHVRRCRSPGDLLSECDPNNSQHVGIAFPFRRHLPVDDFVCIGDVSLFRCERDLSGVTRVRAGPPNLPLVQPGSTSHWGCEGRKFKSSMADQYLIANKGI